MGAAQTQWPSVNTGMNIMVSDPERARGGLVLPVYEEVDGVECDIINVSEEATNVVLPGNEDAYSHLYYRGRRIMSVHLGGHFCRARLKAFRLQQAKVCSWLVLNTSDFELAATADGAGMYAKALEE